MEEPGIIGVISTAVIKTLGEDSGYKAGDMIYLGESNINHMKRRHAAAYIKYNDKLSQIIAEAE